MGLDGVEFVMAVEEAFQIAIPDEDAQRMLTPGDVVSYVLSRLGSEKSHACLEQRAFYRLRNACMKVFSKPRTAIKPNTRWDDILPTRQRRHNWHLLHQATGTPHWPRLTILGRVPAVIATVGETARRLVSDGPAVFKHPEEGWTRRNVEDIIRKLMRDRLGITEFLWEQEFVKDLGVD